LSLLIDFNLTNITPNKNGDHLTNESRYSLVEFNHELYLKIIYSSVESDQEETQLLSYHRKLNNWTISENHHLSTDKHLSLVPSNKTTDNQGRLSKILESNKRIYTLKLAPNTINYSKEENQPIIYVNIKHELNQWQEANLWGFGDVNNKAITEIVILNDSLYAATFNLERGFQIWKTIDLQQIPYHWQLILSHGAYRYSLNQIVFFMVNFKGEIYLASGISVANANIKNIGYPAGFELIRLYSDNDWDLIFGMPRFTPQGLKIPLTAQGPGLDDPNNHTVQCLVTHNERLYLGFQKVDGFQLWGTDDGETWQQLPVNELSHYYRVEVLDVLSTSLGLVFAVNVVEPNGVNQIQIWLGQ